MLGYDLDDAVYIPADLALALYNRPGLMHDAFRNRQFAGRVERIAPYVQEIVKQACATIDV